MGLCKTSSLRNVLESARCVHPKLSTNLHICETYIERKCSDPGVLTGPSR